MGRYVAAAGRAAQEAYTSWKGGCAQRKRQQVTATEAAAALHAAGRTLAARAALPDAAALSFLAEPERALAAEIAELAAAADAALAELDDEDNSGWTCALDGVSSPLRALYKREDGALVHSLKLQGEVPAPMLHVLSVAREFDLVSTWNKFLLDTCVVDAPALLQVTVYAGLWVPYPLTDRDFCVSVRGLDLLDEHGALLVLFQSAPHADAALPPGAAARVRMGWERACLRLTPLPNGGTRGELCAHVDPAMPGGIEPPRWAVSWALRTLCPFIFAAACRRVARIGEHGCVYAQRLAANPALYDLVREREVACRARMPPEEAAAAPEAAVPGEAEEDAVPRRYWTPQFLAGAGW